MHFKKWRRRRAASTEMGLHWVEQAALEAQAEIAAAAAANEKAKAAEESSRRRRSSSSSSSRHGKKRRRGERPAATAEASFSAVCDRRWSHSDELDQLVQLIRQPRSAAAEESYRSEMRRQVYAELQSIRLRLTQASGWEALSAVPMAPRDSQWRRCAHEVASSLGLATASEGDGAERHVVVSRPAYGTAAAPLSSSDGAGNGHGVDGASASSTSGAVGARFRQQFEAGALCWGRCVDYRCTQRRQGRTLLMECARAGATDALQALLTTSGSSEGAIPPPAKPVPPVNTASLEGYTALHYASWGGHAAAVHALLTAGADVTARNAKGETAEGSALAAGHERVAQVLAAWRDAQQLAARTVAVEQLEEGEVLSEEEQQQEEEEPNVGATGNSKPSSIATSATSTETAAATTDDWLRQQRPAATFLRVVSSGAKGVPAGLAVRIIGGAETCLFCVISYGRMYPLKPNV